MRPRLIIGFVVLIMTSQFDVQYILYNHVHLTSHCVISASSFVYHHIDIILSTQSVGVMLWSVVQLRRGRLRMVVYVVGSG